MRSPKASKLIRKAAYALESTGLPNEIKPGSRHHKVYLDGHLVCVIPRTGRKEGNRRRTLNMRAEIRRAAQGRERA